MCIYNIGIDNNIAFNIEFFSIIAIINILERITLLVLIYKYGTLFYRC